MNDQWNDLAQSDKEGPSLFTQVTLIIAVSVMVMVFFLGMWLLPSYPFSGLLVSVIPLTASCRMLQIFMTVFWADYTSNTNIRMQTRYCLNAFSRITTSMLAEKWVIQMQSSRLQNQDKFRTQVKPKAQSVNTWQQRNRPTSSALLHRLEHQNPERSTMLPL